MKPTTLLLGLVLLLAALWAAKTWGYREGVGAVHTKQADAKVEAERDTVRRRDSVFVVDSTAFRVYAARYKKLRDSLNGTNPRHLRPTTEDSVPALNGDSASKVTPLVALCDSTVRLAETALSSCAARVRAGDSLLAATQARLKLEQQRPGPRRFPNVILGALIGTDGRVRLGVGVGIRLW